MNQITTALGADWCHAHNEIAYVDGAGLYVWNVDTITSTSILTGIYARKPRFSPSCDQITYVGTTGVWIVGIDGSNNTQILTNADYPDWIDENHILFQREVGGNADIYLYSISTTITTQLTTNLASDTEPTFVKAFGPSISIEAPITGTHQCNPVLISGFVASEGIPTVTVNGTPATVVGDQWFVSLMLNAVTNSVSAQVVDSATGLLDQDEINVDRGYCVFIPSVWKE